VPQQRPEDGRCRHEVKVHSLENLDSGGSRVFATSGYTNPT